MKFHKQLNGIGEDNPQDLISEDQVFWCDVGFWVFSPLLTYLLS